MERPTIDELQKIIDSADDAPVQIMPNGEVRAGKPEAPATTVPRLLKDACDGLRNDIHRLELRARVLKDEIARDRRALGEAFPGQTSEVLGHITLAFRHLEDARMRVGKVIQYSGDGTSIYDK